MIEPVRIGDRRVGPGQPCYVVAEIGINHNGDLENASELIDAAAEAGCDAVKFQKRTPEICTPRDQWDIERDTPWGAMTYIDYRHRVEFGEDEYRADRRALPRRTGIDWFASPLGTRPSVDFLEKFDAPAHKVASASLTDDDAAARAARDRAAGHPLHRHVAPRSRSATRSRSSAATTSCCCHGTEHLPGAGRGAQPPRDQHPARPVPNVPIGYSGHETGSADHAGRGRARRLLRRAAHHPRPRDVGLRPGRLRRAAGPRPPRPRHPHHRGRARRRRQEGLRERARPMEKLRRVS